MTSKQIQANLRKLGLINEDGTKVLYSVFKNKATISRYGKNQLKVVFIGEPKNNLFGFYANQKGSDTEVMKDAYQDYAKLVKGDNGRFDLGLIKWHSTGIPLRYGKSN